MFSEFYNLCKLKLLIKQVISRSLSSVIINILCQLFATATACVDVMMTALPGVEDGNCGLCCTRSLGGREGRWVSHFSGATSWYGVSAAAVQSHNRSVNRDEAQPPAALSNRHNHQTGLTSYLSSLFNRWRGLGSYLPSLGLSVSSPTGDGI